MTSVSWNGLTFNVPGTGDTAWSGTNGVDGLLVSLAQNGFQKTGGLFTLSADSDFGPSAGLVSLYYKSRTANVASTGQIRLAVGDAINFRNNANGADLVFSINGSDQLQFQGNALLTSTGSLTANRVVATNGSAAITTSSVTTTTLAFLDATSSIQTQLNLKAPLASPTFTGTIGTALTVSSVVKTDGSGNLTVGTVSLTTQVSGILPTANGGTGQGGSATFPASGVVVTEAGSETLTNKTLTSPAINSPTITGLNVAINATPKTSNYTLTTTDDEILGNASGGAFTFTLPTAVGASGKIYLLKRTDQTLANQITVNTTSSQTIDGITSTTLATQYESIRVRSDGANWQIDQRYIPSVWTTYTVTIVATGTSCAKGTVSLDRAAWKRIGDSMAITYQYIQTAGGTAGTGNYKFGLPSGATVNTSITSVGTLGASVLGAALTSNAADGLAASSSQASAFAYDSTNFGLKILSTATVQVIVGASGAALNNTNLIYEASMLIPITGWAG